MALYNIPAYRLPPALRHRLPAELGPMEAALHRHGSGVHWALISCYRCASGNNAVRRFVIGDEHGPIAYVIELLSRGDALNPTVMELDNAIAPHAGPDGWAKP